MIDPKVLQRLAEDIHPTEAQMKRMRARVASRVRPAYIETAVKNPAKGLQHSLWRTIARRIDQPLQQTLPGLAADLRLSTHARLSLRERVVERLLPRRTSWGTFGFKWAVAFTIIAVLLKITPPLLLAPRSSASLGTQVIASGTIQVVQAGVATNISQSVVLSGPALIRTGENSAATVIMGDKGVFRLGPGTEARLRVMDDRQQGGAETITLVSGSLWVLGLLPPTVQGFTIQGSFAMMEVHAGSVSMTDDGKRTTVSVFDRGATVHTEHEALPVVSGQRVVVHAASNTVTRMPQSMYDLTWVVTNLARDAVHREDIAKTLEDRRRYMAGVLPGSRFYLAKRVAEEVDWALTFGGKDERTAKRLEQAKTRLYEGITLIDNGEEVAAEQPLKEFSSTLIALLADAGDNYVKEVIMAGLDQASATLSTSDPDAERKAVEEAIIAVSDAVPEDENLSMANFQGYVLMDRMLAFNADLAQTQNLSGALTALADIKPYLADLLSEESDMHPLLKEEVKAQLAVTSSQLESIGPTANQQVAEAVRKDLAEFMPAKAAEVVVSQYELDEAARVIFHRVYNVLKTSHARERQLEIEIDQLRGNKNEASILRRLSLLMPKESRHKRTVLNEIKKLGGEIVSPEALNSEDAPPPQSLVESRRLGN